MTTNNQNSLDELRRDIVSKNITCACACHRPDTLQLDKDTCCENAVPTNPINKHFLVVGNVGRFDTQGRIAVTKYELAAINKTIMEDLLAMIGPDVVEESDDTGRNKVNKYLVAENRLKRQLRQQITKKYGRADNE